jgi:uncharacterized membrane protein YesL
MDKIFQDNPFWHAMEIIFDLVILNVLWLLCCIPIFTIGPSTCAFFYVALRRIHGEEPPIAGDFFYSFRQNFKQGILLGLPLTLVGTFLALDIYLCRQMGTGIYTFLMVFFSVLFLCWVFVSLYAYPLLAKFEKTNREILVLAFSLSIKHIGKTLLMILVIVIALWAIHLLPGLVFVAPGLAMGNQAVLFHSIMKKYLPEDPDNSALGDVW